MFQGPAILDNPPVLTAPADITVNATSAAGATVDFTATATDVEDGALTPLCTPASGTTFAIGPTQVTCSATDSAQATATATFNVTVLNNPPELTVPTDITVNATSAAGATVDFTPSATDVEDGDIAAVCTPASSTTFAIGTTPVTCSVTDSAQATATTFNVTVPNTPPVLSAPANITVTATSTAVATVSFAATASDIQDGPLTPVCTPASGTTFPVGTDCQLHGHGFARPRGHPDLYGQRHRPAPVAASGLVQVATPPATGNSLHGIATLGSGHSWVASR